MKKRMKVIVDSKQARAGIPKKFVEEFKITREDEIEWDNSRGSLKGKLKKNDERRYRK